RPDGEARELPPDLARALKEQTRDRLAPARYSVGEIAVVVLVALVVLGLVGGHGWRPGHLLVLIPILVAYCAASLLLVTEDEPHDS
ncbi:MAG: hypothetical protein RQ745_11410, partial [Longimicrobiales bacterium]|nr:hypothetical protein [Longimicrobiales bacterium]